MSKSGRPHLETRVPEAVLEAAEVAISKGEAGKVLGEAWRELYGVNPDPSKAYGHAIKAIETAAHDLIEPRNQKATLGTMIREMRRDRANWDIPTDGEHALETVVDMMETVWTGQTDRHGAKGGPVPLVQGAAEVAVNLAVSLVSLFAGGIVTKNDE